MTAPGYAALGIYKAGQNKPSLLSVNGRVVVFDTPEMAKNVVPVLGEDRPCTFSADGESAYFLPLDPNGVNRVVVLTDYDPYNLPSGLPMRSETRLTEWKGHVMWHLVFADCGQFEARGDGTYRNTAIGEAGRPRIERTTVCAKCEERHERSRDTSRGAEAALCDCLNKLLWKDERLPCGGQRCAGRDCQSESDQPF